jgi:hypothetical protein
LLLRGYQFCLINPTRGKRRNKKTHCKSLKIKIKITKEKERASMPVLSAQKSISYMGQNL